MAIQDDIYHLILAGELQQPFRATDLMKHAAGYPDHFIVNQSVYSANTLRTTLPNRSISRDGKIKGADVRSRLKPLFYREETRAWYSLIVNLELGKYPTPVEESAEEEASAGAPADNAGFSRERPLFERCLTPAELIFRTVAETPYRAWFRRQRRFHPQSAARGWKERLDSYFWPSLDKDWQANVRQLGNFQDRFTGLDLESGSRTDQEELLQLFGEICAWGGVRRPRVSGPDLQGVVRRTLAHIDNGTTPQSEPINSAWTKLYAIARPNRFVIYDSRVATAITTILDPYMESCAQGSWFSAYSRLGYINGRGGTRPRALRHDWPNGYKNWGAQLAANRLCLDVLALLKDRSPKKDGEWTLREVEAVLFMEGY